MVTPLSIILSTIRLSWYDGHQAQYKSLIEKKYASYVVILIKIQDISVAVVISYKVYDLQYIA